VQPPVYLIKDFDNTVIFPSENSNPASLNPSGSYEVQGSDKPSTSPAMLIFTIWVIRTAAKLVKHQVGFDVVLLDCRLFPLIECETTSNPDFWKSTHKIVVAPRSTYEKLVGVSVGEELSQVEDDDAVIEQPRKKRKTSEDGTTLKLQSIDEKLDQIDKKLSFIEEIRKLFECMICQSSAKSPVVAVYCQNLVGCRECVQRWRHTNTCCPLCSVTGRMAESFCLQGFDDLLGVSNHSATSSLSPVIDVEATSEDLANEFEEMPPFQAPRAS